MRKRVTKCWPILLWLAPAACGLAPSAPPVRYAATTDPAARQVEAASATAPFAASFPIYAEHIPDSPEKVFGAALGALRAQGDEIEQADSDRGLIITRESRHGGFVLAAVYAKYIIFLVGDSGAGTKMTFRVTTCHLGDKLFPEESEREPLTYDVQITTAARFVAAVRNH